MNHYAWPEVQLIYLFHIFKKMTDVISREEKVNWQVYSIYSTLIYVMCVETAGTMDVLFQLKPSEIAALSL